MGHSILDKPSTMSEFSCPTKLMLEVSTVYKNSSHVTYIYGLHPPYTHSYTCEYIETVLGTMISISI